MEDPKTGETLIFMKKIWALFLIATYMVCFYNESYFPGFRTAPLEGEEILWKIERVLFFALLALGFLIDIVQMRFDRGKAFGFLFLSLVVGGVANFIGAMQYRAVAGLIQMISG